MKEISDDFNNSVESLLFYITLTIHDKIILNSTSNFVCVSVNCPAVTYGSRSINFTGAIINATTYDQNWAESSRVFGSSHVATCRINNSWLKKALRGSNPRSGGDLLVVLPLQDCNVNMQYMSNKPSCKGHTT